MKFPTKPAGQRQLFKQQPQQQMFLSHRDNQPESIEHQPKTSGYL